MIRAAALLAAAAASAAASSATAPMASALERELSAAGVLTDDPPLAIDGVQLRTTRDVADGALLLSLPRELVLRKDSAQEGELLAHLDPPDGRAPAGLPHWAELPDAFVLCLQLLLLRRRPPDGASAESSAAGGRAEAVWRSWLELAPAQLHGIAHWASDERAWLEGAAAADGADGADGARESAPLLAALRRAAPEVFGAIDETDLVDAAAIVAAHSLTAPFADGPMLLPLPHLCLSHDSNVALADDGARVELRAAGRMRAGTPLCAGAGDLDHAALMARQGTPGVHVAPSGLPHPPAHAAAVLLTLSVPDGDGLLDLKAMLLQKHGLDARGHTFALRYAPPPPSLMGLARVLVLQESEVDMLPADGGLPLAPLSAANEDAAHRYVASRVEAKLGAYAATTEEDEYELGAIATEHGAAEACARRGAGGGAGDVSAARRAAAVSATLLEKRVLHATLGALAADLTAYLSSAARPNVTARAVRPPRASRAPASTGHAPPDAAAAMPFNLTVRHGPVGLELVRRPEDAACAVLAAASVVEGGVAAASGRFGGNLALHMLGGRPAAQLTVREVQRRVLAATPSRPLSMRFVPEVDAPCAVLGEGEAAAEDGDGLGPRERQPPPPNKPANAAKRRRRGRSKKRAG